MGGSKRRRGGRGSRSGRRGRGGLDDIRRRRRTASGYTPGERTLTAGLVFGYLFFTIGIVAAHFSPADSFEVSIYAATPALYWLGIAAALLAAVVCGLFAQQRHIWLLGLVLGGLAVVSMIALPMLRGYYFYGLNDSLTHLGWAREMKAGERSFGELVYPAAHMFTAMVSALTGMSVRYSMLFYVVAVSAAYVAFIPLCVKNVLPYRLAVTIAALSAFMVLPINNISMHLYLHTSTQATFFAPIVLYFLLQHVTMPKEEGIGAGVISAATMGLPLSAIALLFYHPQVTALMILLFGTIVSIQFLARTFRPETIFAKTQALYANFAALAVLFLVWNSQHTQMSRTRGYILESVVSLLTGSGGSTTAVEGRGSSLADLGVTTQELFVKMFLVEAVYVVLAALVVLALAVGLVRNSTTESDIAVSYFAASGFPIGLFVGAHVFGRISEYMFRYLGFVMAIVTIVASIGIFYLVNAFDRPDGAAGRVASGALSVFMVFALVLSLIALYPSPFIYTPNHHVSEYQLEGHVDALQMAEDRRGIAKPRVGPHRYADAASREFDGRLNWGLNGSQLRNMSSFHGNDFAERGYYYLVVGETDRETEVVAYRELRFSREDFDSVDSHRGASRVMSNGEVNMYHVRQSEGARAR